MNKQGILKLILLIEIMLLLSNTFFISRDYQDSWILEDLEIFFSIFLFTYLIFFYTEKNITWIIIFALIFRFTILSVPALKYKYYLGISIDPHRHYRLTQDIYNSGQIRTNDLYSGTPFMHLSFVIYSIFSGFDIVNSMKYFPILSWLVYPIIIYIIIKKIYPENFLIQKYALLLSSVPVKKTISYGIIGTLFGPLWIFLILYLIIKLNSKRNISNLFILFIYAFTLSATHSFSSITFSILLVLMYVFIKLYNKIKFIKTNIPLNFKFSTIYVIIMISISWFIMVSSTFSVSLKGLYREFVTFLNIYDYPEVETFIFPRFFEINLFTQARIILVYHGADIFFILLTLLSIFILYKKRVEKKSELLIFLFYAFSLTIFFIFGGIFNIGMHWYDRVLRLFLVITPIFSSITLQYIKIHTHKNITTFIIISILLMLSIIELYGCQPLIPSANSYSKDLPSDEPIVYVFGVNTIYQRSMIIYAESFISNDKKVASDGATENQIFGLTDLNFSKSQTYYYPLSSEMRPRSRKDFNYFLIHLPGSSGAFQDKAETRTKNLILSAIYNSSYSITYTNSKSYILLKNLSEKK